MKRRFHWYGRPPPDHYTDIRRLAENGRDWIEDDGKAGLAFVAKTYDGTPKAFATFEMGHYWIGEYCPCARAMGFCAALWGAANGRNLMPVCRWCARPEETHVNGQCLFTSTRCLIKVFDDSEISP